MGPVNKISHVFTLGHVAEMLAMPRTPRSAALFDKQMRPSSRRRVNAIQRLSM